MSPIGYWLLLAGSIDVAVENKEVQEKVVLGFREICESQGPDLNRRWAALQAAAFGRTLPPWRVISLLLRSFKRSGTAQLLGESHIRRKPHTADAVWGSGV